MRNRTDRDRDRASFLTPPFEEPPVMLAHAIRELCFTIDDAAELIVSALEVTRANGGEAPSLWPANWKRRQSDR